MSKSISSSYIRKLPVLVISGFLGAGKTTLLKNILENNQDLTIALIVNDIGEINIDAALIKNSTLSQTTETIVEMTNGCICCTLREDLLIEIQKLAKTNKYDYLVIESSGVSEPLPVAQTFSFEDENGVSLSQFATLDAMATVVDAHNFWQIYNEGKSLKDIGQEIGVKDDCTLADLLTDQVEFADILILNKLDLVEDQTKRDILDLVGKLNPVAKIIEATNSKVDVNNLLNTKLFNLEKAQNSAGWIHELEHEHKSETLEYGITSFVYRARKPFDAKKFQKTLTKLNGVIRGKGMYWIESDNRNIFEYSQAGRNISLGNPLGIWWCVATNDLWPADQASIAKIESFFEGEAGDRRQELVFIGKDINQKEITEKLNNCLVEPNIE
jgi:G3E family GTPase